MTTNKIKSFAANNQYIKMYLNDYETRGHYIYQKTGKNPLIDNGKIDLNSNFRNSLYRRAWNEFNHKFGNPETHIHISFMFEGIKWGGWLNIEIDGDCRYVIDSAKFEDKLFYKLPFVDDFHIRINIKGCLSSESVIKQAISHINGFLYAPGFFRDVQTCRLWTKERTKEAVKRAYKLPLMPYDETEVENWIKRHFNIDLSAMGLSERSINYCRKYGKHERLSVLHIAPNPFDILEDCEDDDIESAYYEYMAGYPNNAIFC